jgi:hypothetical protein
MHPKGFKSIAGQVGARTDTMRAGQALASKEADSLSLPHPGPEQSGSW